MLASLTAGLVMGLFEYAGIILSLTPDMTAVGSLANFLASVGVYTIMAAATGLIPVLAIGFCLWWFQISNLSAYVLAGLVIAALLVVSGFGEVWLIPAFPAAGLVFWLTLWLFGRRSKPEPTS